MKIRTRQSSPARRGLPITITAAALVALAACTSARTPPPPTSAPPPPPPAPSVGADSPPPSTTSTPARSPFHVLGVSVLRGRKTIDETTLCPLEGAVFLCGVRRMIRLEGDDLVHDPALEAGLPRDAAGRLAHLPLTMIGRWPDDAWLLTSRWGPILYRWKEKEKRWAQVHAWPSIGSLEMVDVASWSRGRVLVLRGYIDGYAFETYGEGPAPPLPKPTPPKNPVFECNRSMMRGYGLTVAKDGAIAVHGQRCEGGSATVVERWSPNAAASTVTLVEPTLRTPEAERGTFFFADGKLVQRSDRGALVPVTLPEISPPALPGSDGLYVRRLWELAPGDVWALAHFRNPDDLSLAVSGAAILRTVRPKRPLNLAPLAP